MAIDDCKGCKSFHWASAVSFLSNKTGHEIELEVVKINAQPYSLVTATQIFPRAKGIIPVTSSNATQEVQFYDCFIYYKVSVVIPSVTT